MANSPTVEQIQSTVDLYAPNGGVICVGSAALALQFAEVGVNTPPPADVDVLTSEDYYKWLLGTRIQEDDYQSFHVENTWGALRERGINMKWARIVQDSNRHPDILPYEASMTLPIMSDDSDTELSYNDSIGKPDRIVEASNVQCLRVGEILKTLAVVGRIQDLDKVERLTPVAEANGLIGQKTVELIRNEYEISRAARNMHPYRRYARIDASTDQPLLLPRF